MESKLKSLKVAELKELLAGVNIATPNRATKADLISKIVESQAAQDAYMTKYEPNHASAAPAASVPEPAAVVDVEPEVTEAEPEPEPEPTPATSTTSAPTTDPAPAAAAATPAIKAPDETTEAPEEDAEAALAARKARAERFGIPFVEDPAAVLADAKNERHRGGRGGRKARGGGILSQPEKPAAKEGGKGREAKGKGGIEKVEVDGEKLKSRAERFGLKPGENKRDNKRKSPAVEEVDAEEAERRRKRAERFGTGPAAAATAAA
ncbi:unnamed protein product [Peniophora sp. CBMAI 1063]|nr:unnamed protein product [Peniophora sp. CBMAI 1063]